MENENGILFDVEMQLRNQNSLLKFICWHFLEGIGEDDDEDKGEEGQNDWKISTRFRTTRT